MFAYGIGKKGYCCNRYGGGCGSRRKKKGIAEKACIRAAKKRARRLNQVKQNGD